MGDGGGRADVTIVDNESGEQQEAVPLTASFEGMPSSHAGSGTFGFRIVFSEAVTITEAAFRDHALEVRGGSLTAASRVAGREGVWSVTLAPDSSGGGGADARRGPRLRRGGRHLHRGRSGASQRG